MVIAYGAGYFSLMFLREAITLRDTFLLHCLFINSPNSKTNSAYHILQQTFVALWSLSMASLDISSCVFLSSTA